MRKIKILFSIFCIIGVFIGFVDKRPTPYVFPDLPTFPEMPVSAQNPVTYEGMQLGRYLFYDPILSQDSSMSCASCHQQKYAFSDAPKAFSTGLHKTSLTRNTLPLFNLAWYPSFFWDGRALTLEQQVLFPVKSHEEMDLDWITASKRVTGSTFYRSQFQHAFGKSAIDSTDIAYAIAQFLRTLISYQSKYDLVYMRKATFTDQEYNGFELVNDMTRGDCLLCHTTDGDALGTTAKFSNNGLDSIVNATEYSDAGLGKTTNKLSDNGKFKIPSLRNIALTAPYMHDGRFKTLEEVLDFYSEGVHFCANIDSKMEFARTGGSKLTSTEKKNIIAFLNTFTDSVFISNPAFSNPFEK
ncbi:MAG TPA: cytochrome c peroxidase [Bacteroidia bacterium]|jgi:cytochrome c peroxidase|nr:cytochrome c peroxidase [Bacteroidia bacterium]